MGAGEPGCNAHCPHMHSLLQFAFTAFASILITMRRIRAVTYTQSGELAPLAHTSVS